MTKETRYEQGLEMLKRIDGEGGEKMVERLRAISPDFSQYLVETIFADLYSRSGLDLKTREIVTLTSMITQGNCLPEVKIHIHAALNVGVTQAEILEIIMHLVPFAGITSAINALLAAQEVFTELNQ
jgi:4-carboxymuconolactone decarboxylase